MENNAVQLLAFLLDAHRRWTARDLAAEVGVCQKTVFHILYDILCYRKLARRWIHHEISEVQQWHRYVATQTLLDRYQREDDFLGRIVAADITWACSYEPNLKRQSNEWNHPGTSRPKKVRPTQCAVNVMFIMAYDIDGGNTAPCCTSKAEGNCSLLLHVPAGPPLSSAQEKTTVGGKEP